MDIIHLFDTVLHMLLGGLMNANKNIAHFPPFIPATQLISSTYFLLTVRESPDSLTEAFRGMDSLLLLCWVPTVCAGILLGGPHSLCTYIKPKHTHKQKEALFQMTEMSDAYTEAVRADKPIIFNF